MIELAEIIAVVVEDDPLNATLLQKMLLMAGVGKVVVCDSGQATRQAVQDLPRVDLMLLDIQLPEEDGFEIMRDLHHLPTMEHTRFVAVTANVLAAYLEQAKTMGFDGFLGKPFHFDDFRTQMIEILEGHPIWSP